jgi:hypothetical protein
MLTRLRQGITAIFSSRTPLPFPEPYRGKVAPGIIAQWDRLSPYDQRHLVAVATDLRRSGLPETVVLAGLLHDIGKAGTVWLPARVLVVLMQRFSPDLARRLKTMPSPPPGLRGLHLLLNHAERGASMLETHGMRSQVSWLVRHHEALTSHPYLTALQAADQRH